MPGWGAAQGEHNLAPRVEPEIIETRDGQKKHDKDEAVVNDDMFYVAHIVKSIIVTTVTKLTQNGIPVPFVRKCFKLGGGHCQSGVNAQTAAH